MDVGETATLSAAVTPLNATNQTVCWTSDNPSIAMVNESTGLVTAVAEGTTTIRAAATDCSEVVGTCSVVVSDEPEYTCPIASGTLTGRYDISGPDPHPAIDIKADEGTPIYAFADGIVSFTQNSSGSWHPDDYKDDKTDKKTMGNCIAINHMNPDPTKKPGLYARTVYMHMRDYPTLADGTAVTKGQIIGYVGNTGRSSAPHLHFVLAVGNLNVMKPGEKGWASTQSVLPTIDPLIYLSEYYIS